MTGPRERSDCQSAQQEPTFLAGLVETARTADPVQAASASGEQLWLAHSA